MNDLQVLNPVLYRRLKRLFGQVRISNQGQTMTGQVVRDPLHGNLRFHRSQVGEQYAVSCCYCGDTRFRLVISYLWGQVDEAGRRLNFLAHCWNEECLQDAANRADLIEKLDDPDGTVMAAALAKVSVQPVTPLEATLPGPVKLLTELPPDHPAMAYMREDRGFDTDLLSRVYRVGYCEYSPMPLASNRIIIPVFENGKLFGWQARYIGELPWKNKKKSENLPPKYWTMPGMMAGSLIYNWDQMKKYRTGIIVEGPADVWSFGPMAGCVFGKRVSPLQLRKLRGVFWKRSLVLLLDPEEFATPKTQEQISQLRREFSRFAAVQLPVGTDPGSLDRDFLHEYVVAEAAQQGVQLDLTKEEDHGGSANVAPRSRLRPAR